MKKIMNTILAFSLAVSTVMQLDIDVIKANQQAYEESLPTV